MLAPQVAFPRDDLPFPRSLPSFQRFFPDDLACAAYLEAIRWPVEFVFDHKQKISKICELIHEPFLLPHRGSKPYLWQDTVLQRPSGEVVLTMVDHFGRHPYRQLYRHLKRFAPALGPDRLRLMIVVSSERREQLFRRQLNRTRLQRLLESQGVYLPLRDMVTIYRVRRAVPVVRPVTRDATTALGSAYAAGLAIGYFKDLADLRANWAMDYTWRPNLPQESREEMYKMWKRAVTKSFDWEI